MKKILSVLSLMFMLAIPAFANATTVVLQWTLTTDATVAGQKVYYGQGTVNSGTVTCPAVPYTGSTATQGAAGFPVPNGTGATVAGLVSTNAWCFYVTNTNAAGMESAISNIVSVPAFPAGVTGVVIKSITQ
ncbi:MAG: hypothetical protein ABSB40_13215 [Nitrososphaeria archaeon]|jgi:hypothetical protein